MLNIPAYVFFKHQGEVGFLIKTKFDFILRLVSDLSSNHWFLIYSQDVRFNVSRNVHARLGKRKRTVIYRANNYSDYFIFFIQTKFMMKTFLTSELEFESQWTLQSHDSSRYIKRDKKGTTCAAQAKRQHSY
jgi:hypothetical protein